MSNRIYTQFHLSLEKQPVMLWAKAAIGASGAPTLNVPASKGVASIVRDSAGLYTITLTDAYQKLFLVQDCKILAAGAPSSVGGMIVRSATIPGKVIQVLFVDGAGAAVELNSGTTLLLKFELGRSSV